MPHVVLRRDPAKVPDDLVYDLGRWLPFIVANALRVEGDPGIPLQSYEVAVEVQDVGPHDVNAASLGITVYANYYPERAENIQERTEAVAKRIHDLGLYPEDSAGYERFVWIFLGHAGFANIQAEQKDDRPFTELDGDRIGYMAVRTGPNVTKENARMEPTNPDGQRDFESALWRLRPGKTTEPE